MSRGKHPFDELRRKRTPCTHTFTGGSSWVTWYDATGTPTDEEHGVQRRCLYCGEQQSLGDAPDPPAAELELAESIAEIHVMWEPRNHDEMIAIAVDDSATDWRRA